MQSNYDVLIVGGAPFKAYDWLFDRARSVKHIIAVDRGGAHCLRSGIKPNVLLGDLDSIKLSDVKLLQTKHTQKVQFSKDKDKTDLRLALQFAKKEFQAKRVLLTACVKGRFDHELGMLGACLATKGVAIDIATPHMRAYLLRPRARGALTLPASSKHVSIISLSEPCLIQTMGLKWNLNNEELSVLSDRGVSNLVLDDSASIFCKKGAALVVCC